MGSQPGGHFHLRAVSDRDIRRGAVADFFLPGHAIGAHHVPARSDGRNDRDGFVEITRRVLVWYYAVVSSVNLIYGSFATSVVA